MKRSLLFWTALAAALLAGCGGGAPADVAVQESPQLEYPAGADIGSMVARSGTAATDPQPEAVPEVAERESAQSLSIDSNDVGYAKPKVAGLDYDGSDSGSTKQALLAKFNIAIVGARSGSNLHNFTEGIYARNHNVDLAIYTIPTEVQCSEPSSTAYAYTLWRAVQSTDWWLHKADGSRSQWSSGYNACDINFTAWSRRDSSGHTWQQYKYSYDKNRQLASAPHAKWWFSDNGWSKPRVDADWKRIGTNQSRTDPTVVSAVRAGMASYWDLLHDSGRMRVMANVDNDLSFSPYRGKLRGAFMEGAMGKNYSLETWAGWGAMMTRYRALIHNTYGHVGVMQVYGSPTDYRQMRYGLASALLEDGYFCYLPSSGTLKAAWYDEFDAPIGTPAESPPTAAKQNGIWQRRYTNALVLVNPSKTATASIYVGSGYKRLRGTQDSAVNNGTVQSTVTLGPRQGLLMVRN